MRVSNSRFCKDHKRSADAMSYQAEKSDDPEAKETFDQIFADDAAMAAAVNQFSKDNPPCAKYKRKQMIDWLQYKRSYGTRVTRRDRGTDVPKTEKEFKLWCVNVKGLTEQETKDWWAKLLDSPGVDRDYEGYGGKLRLYIPNAEEGRDRLRDQYIDNRQEEGSAVDKRAKPQDQEELRRHVHRQQVSFADAFFQGGHGGSRSSTSAGSKRKAGDEEDPDAEKPSDPRHAKKVCMEREVPKFGVAMSKNMATLKVEMQKSFVLAKKASEILEKTDAPLNDKPSYMFKATLQFRMQLGVRWLDDVNKVVVLKTKNARAAGGLHAGETPSPSPQAAVPDLTGSSGDQCKGEDNAEKGQGNHGNDQEIPAKTDNPGNDKEIPAKTDNPGNDKETATTPKKEKLEQDARSPAQSEKSMQIVFANSEPQLLQDYKSAVRQQSTSELLANNPHKKPFDQDPKTFRTNAEMTREMQRIMEISDEKEFLKARDAWNATVTTVKEFIKNLGRASSDLVTHIKSLETKARAEKEKSEKERQKADVAKAREEAKKAAEDIRRNLAKTEAKPLLSDVDFAAAKVPEICKHEGNGFHDKKADEPCVLINNDKQKLWLASEAVDKALATYGTAYKKAKDVKANGRGQAPIQDAAAKDETSEFLLKLLPDDTKVLNIENIVEGGSAFMDNCWSYSFMPGNVSFSIPPNGAAFVRAQALGTTSFVLFKLKSLLSYVKSKHAADADKKPALELVTQWGQDAVANALGEEADGKVEMIRGSLSANQAMFVPSGWVILERAHAEQAAIYGVRKSMFIDSVQNYMGYEAIKMYYEACSPNRDLSRMTTILEAFMKKP
ncbi:unnamed protein product [Symbiodinium sp. KB8]|nr:unnamed protein product [Symbiodinium sp. KB8]